jgi:hypothetical protein
LACAIGATCSLCSAQTSSTTRSERTRAADIAAFLAALPTWSTSTGLRASYGYNDNLLLSAAGEERSAFVRGTADLLLLRIPTGRFDYSFFAQAERTRYISGESTDHDAKVWIQSEPGYRLSEALKFAVPVTGYYYDQVFDVSATEVERDIAEIKVKGIMAGPTVRWDFHPSWWVEAQTVMQRKRYEDGANDGRIGEGGVRLGWVLGRWLEVRASVGRRWRDFDHRAKYNSAGFELADTELKISEREGELRFDISWDEAGQWETSTRVSLLHYRDNGSGYFNYREQRVTQDVEWEGDVWSLRLSGSASRLDFGVQKAALGIDPPARLKDEFSGGVQVERTLTERWTIFGGYTWERSRSNDTMASYTMNEGLLGLRWSWKK